MFPIANREANSWECQGFGSKQRKLRWHSSSHPRAPGGGDEAHPSTLRSYSPTWSPPYCTPVRWIRLWKSGLLPTACTNNSHYILQYFNNLKTYRIGTAVHRSMPNKYRHHAHTGQERLGEKSLFSQVYFYLSWKIFYRLSLPNVDKSV